MAELASVDMEPGVFVENAEEAEGGVSEEVLDRLREALVEETGATYNDDGSITYERSEDMDPPKPGDPEVFTLRPMYASDLKLRELHPPQSADDNDWVYYGELVQQLSGHNNLVVKRLAFYDMKSLCHLIRSANERALLLEQKAVPGEDGTTTLKILHRMRSRTSDEQKGHEGPEASLPDTVTVKKTINAGMMMQSERIRGGAIHQGVKMISLCTDMSMDHIWRLDIRDFTSIDLEIQSRKKKRGRKKKAATIAGLQKSS